MNLTYAILSSNDNPKYLDLWPFVSSAWRNLIGIEPVLFYIGKEENIHELSKYGQVIQTPEHPKWDIVNQSQSIRLWAGTKFPNDNIIISDLDMLPINKDYYLQQILDYPDDKIISYTSDVLNYGFYRINPQLPMCYLAGKGSTFNEILCINESTSWFDFVNILKSSNLGYGTDQKYFYKMFQRWPRKNQDFIGLSRTWIDGKIASKRLDKVVWPASEYDPHEFYDSHLPVPMSENYDKCSELFKKLNLI